MTTEFDPLDFCSFSFEEQLKYFCQKGFVKEIKKLDKTRVINTVYPDIAPLCHYIPNTALDTAIEYERVEVIEYLLSIGANFTHRTVELCIRTYNHDILRLIYDKFGDRLLKKELTINQLNYLKSAIPTADFSNAVVVFEKFI